jgi:hypothetical protein
MRKSNRSYLIWGIALLIILGLGGRLIFPPYGNLSKELSAGNFTAGELFQEFSGDPVRAYMLYANKAIVLEGAVAATGQGYIMVGENMSVIRCIFRKTIYDRKPGLKTGDRVILKGICRGLNMTEVLVTHCILINKVSI